MISAFDRMKRAPRSAIVESLTPWREVPRRPVRSLARSSPTPSFARIIRSRCSRRSGRRRRRARARAVALRGRSRRRRCRRAAADAQRLPAARAVLPAASARQALILTEGGAGSRPIVGGPGGGAARRRAALRMAGVARPSHPLIAITSVSSRRTWRSSICSGAPACGKASSSTSGSASSTSSSCRSSGRSPTTSIPKGRGGGCFRSSVSAHRSAPGLARRPSRRSSDAPALRPTR